MGDLDEIFFNNLSSKGKTISSFIYLWQVFGFIKLKSIENRKFFSATMIYHYLVTALRNLKFQKTFTAINLFGLSSSMALCLLMIMYYTDQKGMDMHNSEANNIYRVLTTKYDEEKEDFRNYATSPYDIADRLKGNFKEVKETSRLMKEQSEIKFGDKVFGFTGLYAESNFLPFFQFELLAGNPSTVLNKPRSIVLTQELASKLFSNEQAVGQTVQLKNGESYVVSGVMKELSGRTHLNFDLLISFNSLDKLIDQSQLQVDWNEGSDIYYNYFLHEELEPNRLENYLKELTSLFPEENTAGNGFKVQRLSEFNFGESVRSELGFVTPAYIPWFLGILSALVMLSACFNYIGLSIAQSLKRAKEVGIRKVMGAGKKHVIMQFLVEAQIIVLISWILSMVLLTVLVPLYNNMKVLRDIEGQIHPDVWGQTYLFAYFLLFAILIGLISGGYPAWYIGKRAFNKNKMAKAPGVLLRKSLVFIQYTTSIIFIITAVVVSRQSKLFFNMEYGFEKENMVSFPINDIQYNLLKAELKKSANIESISLTSALPAVEIMPTLEIALNENSKPLKVSSFSVNEDFIENFGLNLVLGTNFIGSHQSNEDYILVNSKLLEELSLDPQQAIENGTRIKVPGNGKSYKIIGVIESFKYQMLFRESGALLLTYTPKEFKHLNIKYSGWDRLAAAENIEKIWRQFDKVHPFEFVHLDYMLSDMYDEFQDIAKIVGLVAIMAIFIACIGQFGMILHHVELKTKEVGIRKVLGSSTSQLIFMLSKNFVFLIGFSLLIGTPVAWWINSKWTSKVGYHVDVDGWIIAQGIVSVVALSALAIFTLTSRAANMNPVKSIKYE